MDSSTSKSHKTKMSMPPTAPGPLTPMMYSQTTPSKSVSKKDVMISYSHQDMDYMRKIKGKNVQIPTSSY